MKNLSEHIETLKAGDIIAFEEVVLIEKVLVYKRRKYIKGLCNGSSIFYEVKGKNKPTLRKINEENESDIIDLFM